MRHHQQVTTKNPEVVKINKVFKPPSVKIFRIKRISRPIPSARRIILSGDKKLNLEAENPTKYPKGKPQRKTSQATTCEICNKTIRTRHEKTVIYYGKMKHIFYAAIHITLRSRTRGLLLYGHASAIIENCDLLLSGISQMSTKTLIYHHQQRTMSMFTLKNSKSTVNIFVSHISILNL